MIVKWLRKRLRKRKEEMSWPKTGIPRNCRCFTYRIWPFAIISIYTSSAGIVGTYLKAVIMGLFGLLGYAVPLLFLIGGGLTIVAYHKKVNKFKLLLVIFTIVFAMAGLHLVYFQQIDSSGIKNFIYSSYEKGQEGIGAGALVSSLVFVMYKLFGIAGGYIFVAVFGCQPAASD